MASTGVSTVLAASSAVASTFSSTVSAVSFFTSFAFFSVASLVLMSSVAASSTLATSAGTSTVGLAVLVASFGGVAVFCAAFAALSSERRLACANLPSTSSRVLCIFLSLSSFDFTRLLMMFILASRSCDSS